MIIYILPVMATLRLLFYLSAFKIPRTCLILQVPHLNEFALQEGHCLVPAKYKMKDGYRLGVWVSGQRYKKDQMPPDQKMRLESLNGWVWDVLSEKWETGFRHLLEYVKQESHCIVPKMDLSPDGYRIGQWVQVQRSSFETMTSDRQARLEILPGWVKCE